MIRRLWILLLLVLSITAIAFAVAYVARLSREAQRAAERAETAAKAAIRAAREPWRERPNWEGTRAYPDSVPAPILAAFKADPPAPDDRRYTFANFLGDGQYKIRGWEVMVDRVTPDSDGWEVSVRVNALLNVIAILSHDSRETWHVSKSGEARCLYSSHLAAYAQVMMTD